MVMRVLLFDFEVDGRDRIITLPFDDLPDVVEVRTALEVIAAYEAALLVRL